MVFSLYAFGSYYRIPFLANSDTIPSRFLGLLMQICSSMPAELFATVGLRGAVFFLSRMIASTPNATLDRIMFPRLPGSSIEAG
jgi:hypothetical protein